MTFAHGLHGIPDVVDIISTAGFFVWTLVDRRWNKRDDSYPNRTLFSLRKRRVLQIKS
jgi:hypothetical protein